MDRDQAQAVTAPQGLAPGDDTGFQQRDNAVGLHFLSVEFLFHEKCSFLFRREHGIMALLPVRCGVGWQLRRMGVGAPAGVFLFVPVFGEIGANEGLDVTLLVWDGFKLL